MFTSIDEEKLETIVGGNFLPELSMTVLLTALAVIVAVYKMYTSSSGKAKIGNDFTFEWA